LRGSGRFPPTRRRAPRSGGRCFNPLHCGAVVASAPPAEGGRGFGGVSIPFIAGQWSLPADEAARAEIRRKMFQSPSLRGSGRFSPARRRGAGFRRCFNPLHCGAVVASGSRPRNTVGSISFQSPSLRGSGRFKEEQ